MGTKSRVIAGEIVTCGQDQAQQEECVDTLNAAG